MDIPQDHKQADSSDAESLELDDPKQKETTLDLPDHGFNPDNVMEDLGGLHVSLCKGLFTDLKITVGDGDTAKEFNVHKLIMASYSGYFLRALTGESFTEAKKSHFTLRNADPRSFERAVAFFYGSWLCDEDVYSTINLYELADYLDAQDLKKAAVADVIDKIGDLKRELYRIGRVKDIDQLRGKKSAGVWGSGWDYDRFHHSDDSETTEEYGVFNIKEAHKNQELPMYRNQYSLFRTRTIIGKRRGLNKPAQARDQTGDLREEKAQMQADIHDRLTEIFLTFCNLFQSKDLELFRAVVKAIVDKDRSIWKAIVGKEEVKNTLTTNPTLANEIIEFLSSFPF